MKLTRDSKISVLIVEDLPQVREGLRSFLSTESSFKVVGEADNGLEAIKLAQKLKPAVILMDIKMPGKIDGLEATREIKKLGIDCEVLMLTFYESQEYLRQALQSGASGYLLKDSDRLDLINAVQTVANGGSLIDPVMLKNFVLELAKNEITNYALRHSMKPDSSNDILAPPNKFKKLTPKEQEVLEYIVEGISNADIAQNLVISQNTLKKHFKSIYNKLGVNDKTNAALVAVKNGILKI